MGRKKFNIISDGKVVSCDALATYHDDSTDKDYIIYTDKTTLNGKLRVFYALYKEVNDEIQLIQIDNKQDELIALKIIQELKKG